jgi:hypothetical protein
MYSVAPEQDGFQLLHPASAWQLLFPTFPQTERKCARFDADQDGCTNFIKSYGTKTLTDDNDSNHNTISLGPIQI